MRILGLDVGDVLIGLAVSDPSGIIAQGLDSTKRVALKQDVAKIKHVVEEYEIEKIVVGLPRMMSGEIGIQAQKVLAFVESLRTEIKIPIIMTDERLTTTAASRTLIEANMRRSKRKKIIDKVAATIILQGYLDGYKHKDSQE